MTRGLDAQRGPAIGIPAIARATLLAFVITFMAARVVVLLIMSRRIPDLYVHLGGTHVHHLNYGIFLLVGVGAWLLVARPTTPRAIRAAAALYGVGLGLTFDEFGMWLHLGGSYWQRASYDAVVSIAAVLGLVAVAPRLRRLRPKHLVMTVLIGIVVVAFVTLQVERLRGTAQRLQQELESLEQRGPD